MTTPTSPPTLYTSNAKNARLVATWTCPVCDGAVANCHRPGRPRIYCTNSCRQKAYRWRRDHSARLHATLDNPPERAFYAYGRPHALRSKRDPASQRSDAFQRELTICGVLARPSRAGKFTHDDFVLDSQHSCVTCIRLVTPPMSDPPPLNPWYLPGYRGPRTDIHPYRPVRLQTWYAEQTRRSVDATGAATTPTALNRQTIGVPDQ